LNNIQKTHSRYPRYYLNESYLLS